MVLTLSLTEGAGGVIGGPTVLVLVLGSARLEWDAPVLVLCFLLAIELSCHCPASSGLGPHDVVAVFQRLIEGGEEEELSTERTN